MSYHVGDMVRHRRFGVGTVIEGGSGRVVIRFPDHGDRVFVPEIAPLTKVGDEAPSEFAASRKNGNEGSLDGIEAYQGGALHASPNEEVRERIQAFLRLGDSQGWDAYDDEPGEDDEDLAEMLAIAAEYGQEQALAKLFAATAKREVVPNAPRDMLRGTRTRRHVSSSRRSKKFSGSIVRSFRSPPVRSSIGWWAPTVIPKTNVHTSA